MLYALDLAGTFVFALSGAFKAVRLELDWLGIGVLAALTGIGGGIVRDVLLGATPPASLQDEAYILVCLAGAAAVVVAAPSVAARWNRVMLADAVGLGLFAALGAAKGLAFGLGPFGVLLTGTLTAVGGGVVRDVLVGEVPAVLHKGFYATAAILGSAVLLGLDLLELHGTIQLAAAALTTTGLRLATLIANTNLPKAPYHPEPDDAL
ncbi:MAG: trimeric intracellular cation channel family protein [Bacteroidota bacterium]